MSISRVVCAVRVAGNTSYSVVAKPVDAKLSALEMEIRHASFASAAAKASRGRGPAGIPRGTMALSVAIRSRPTLVLLLYIPLFYDRKYT